MASWWKNAVVYQVYPKSFQDSNGDGIGDLQGIISRLDYLEKLGIDAIWLSPVYQSPGVDNGYDISDYEAIDPQYGTMADMDELISKAKEHHIKIVMDLVVNHTSDQHKWFVEAKKGKDNQYRDYYIQEMNKATFGKRDVMTVGETWNATPKIAEEYSDPDRHELSMVFQFENQSLDQQPGKEKWDLKPLDLGELKKVLVKWQTKIDFDHAWNSLFWENHDIPRVISRWGNDQEYRVQCAKMFAIILHMMHGTPYIFNGEEIGMTNCPVKNIDEVEDIESINMYNERLAEGYDEEELIHAINVKGRDNARRPMQWNDEKNAGFSEVDPWLSVNPNYKDINVENALADPNSIFYTYQKLIKLRHENPIVVDGDFSLVSNTQDAVLAYYRILNDKKWLVVANLSNEEQNFVSNDQIETILSNYPERNNVQNITLKPYEAFISKVIE